MRFLIFFFICCIFYKCNGLNTRRFEDEKEAAWYCTRPSSVLADYFVCTGYDSVEFYDRILHGASYCLEELIVEDKPYYYCSTRMPIPDGPAYNY